MKRISLVEWQVHGERMTLLGPTFHRARNVLRVKKGEWIAATDGQGAEYTISITGLHHDRIEGKIIKTSRGVGESPLQVILAQVIPRGSRMDFVVQKATELGVEGIVPLLASRSVARPSDESAVVRRLERWEKIALEAVAQCRRTRKPVIAQPLTLEAYLEEAAGPLKLLLHQGRGARTVTDIAVDPPGRVEVIAGPEGGFGSEETEACLAAGFMPVSLGPRILRAETAGVAALALLQYRWGDMG
jgi:16S rRNA (uracil1498-N3)-methyltransferase